MTLAWLYQTDPIHSPERVGSTRYPPADHQRFPGKPLSVKCSLIFHNISGGAAQYWACAFWTGTRSAWQSGQPSALILQLSDLAPPSLAVFTLHFFLLYFCPSSWCGLMQGLFIVLGCWNQPMGLEVPCMLNPRWSTGCPDRARSTSEGYVGGFQLGKEHITLARLYQTDPIFQKGSDQQGILQLTINKFQVSHWVLIRFICLNGKEIQYFAWEQTHCPLRYFLLIFYPPISMHFMDKLHS